MSTSRIASFIVLALFSLTVSAGLYQPAPVVVDLDGRLATGDMQTASMDKSPGVFIGCGTRNYDDGAGGVFKFAFCQAQDADGDLITCGTFNPDLTEAVRAVSDFSYIQFQWDENDECTSIGLSTQSFYLIKAKN